jgi:ribosomal protein S12 methylthiotransferase
MKKVTLITFGCAKNLVDSEVMAGCLHEAGYVTIAEAAKADIVILNTCGFIGPAKDEAEAAIQDVLRLKKKFRNKKIIVTGCYVERDEPFLKTAYPDVDAWVGVKDFDQIVKIIEGRPYSGSGRTFLYGHETPRAISTPASWAYVKISEGCSHHCSFCAIPLIKGAYRSRPISSIEKEVRRLAAGGVREINLISQDTTYFGRDREQPGDLVGLLEKLIRIHGIEWIRLLYGYPEEITDALIEIMEEPKICPYFDIPFQHSDPAIIRRMRRAMDGKRSLKLLDRIRNKLPNASFRTSLIVGFPGEGQKEFSRLQSFVKASRFDHLGVFTYSKEDGTSAWRLKDSVAESAKKSRRDRILEIQAGISAEKLRTFVGRTIDVLIEGTWKDDRRFLIGRSRFQAPEVDGIVLVKPSIGRKWDGGPIQKVEIISSEVYDLFGKALG